MGLPSINIEFKKRASTAVKRSERGVVLLLLKDGTKQIRVNTYTSLFDVVKADFTDKNYLYIKLAFLGKPSKVIVVRAIVSGDNIDINNSKKLIENLDYDYIAIPEIASSDISSFATYIDNNKKTKYKKAKAVLANCEANSHAVINFTTTDVSIILEDKKETLSASEYTARIAGLLAGLSLEESATYKPLSEVVDARLSENPDADIDAGKLILIYDGEKFKIARGITSLTSVSEQMPEDFKKIKIVEASDLIRNDILKAYEEAYLGKMNNNYDNKQMLVGAIRSYLKSLEDILIDKEAGYSIDIDVNSISDYLKQQGVDISKMNELELKKANTGSFVAITGKLKFLDAIEDFKLSMSL